MPLSIQEILNTVEKVPYQLAKQFIDILAAISQSLAHQAEQQLHKQRQSDVKLGGGVTGDATEKPKEFRKPPFIKDLAVDRDQKLSNIETDDPQHQPRIK
jgi:hypothetical protein